MGIAQNFNKKVFLKSSYTKKDGTCPLYIYVSIDSDFDRIPLKLSWPADCFDKSCGKLLPRSKEDTDKSDYQLIIDSEITKVNEIFKEYRLSGKILTIGKFLEEYNSYTSRKDFLSFFLTDANERYKRKKIERGTRNGQVATLNSLRQFWQQEQNRGKKKNAVISSQLPFNLITPNLLENFRAWLKSDKKNIPTTVENHMKNVRTYVKRALADGNVFDDPFKIIKVTKPETWPDVLTQDQLSLLVDLFKATSNDSWHLVLRHFLFSCFTGLRISDAKAVSHENIQDNWLVIMPKKTIGKQKTIRVPLHPLAQDLIVSSVGRLFDTFSEQYTNRLLTRIGQAAGIDFKVKTHTARHTFGTLFIELGGDVVTLKEYMGHRDIGTTMKYIHISEKRKREKINVFDQLFAKNRLSPPV